MWASVTSSAIWPCFFHRHPPLTISARVLTIYLCALIGAQPPSLGEAVFVNHEEVPLKAIYRDPVHDFGIFQFDPARLKHLPRDTSGKLNELTLFPEGAKVGGWWLVVGGCGCLV